MAWAVKDDLTRLIFSSITTLGSKQSKHITSSFLSYVTIFKFSGMHAFFSHNRLPDLKMLIMLGKEKFHGAFNFDDVLEAAGPAEVKAISDIQGMLQFDDPINIQFTSVSTSCCCAVFFVKFPPVKLWWDHGPMKLWWDHERHWFLAFLMDSLNSSGNDLSMDVVLLFYSCQLTQLLHLPAFLFDKECCPEI